MTDPTRLDDAEQQLGKPVQRMSPQELVSYLRLIMRHRCGLDLRIDGAGVKERAVMAHLQKVYGPEGAGLIVKWAVHGQGGECDGKPLTFFSFQRERKWWTDEVYAEAQRHRADYAAGEAWRASTIDAASFLRRFTDAHP